MTNMRRKRNDRGFTMIELLAVVAIIGILAGVGFAAVTTHQKNLARVERDAIAKEIFVAAQNHLTMAESQGYLGIDKTKFGTELTTGPEGSETGTGEYWIAYTGDAANFGNTSNGDVTMLGLMLPFGSLDETVRAGGRYVIHYRPNPAAVLDVFYWTTDSRYGGEISSIDYITLYDQFAGDAKASARRGNKPVMGWYGETASVTLESGKYLEMPSIEVKNEERLIVKVKEPSANRSNSASLKLIVTGVTSGANAAIPLTTDGTPNANTTDGVKQDDGDNYLHIITLDDITTINMHFEAINGNKRSANINISGTFIPGENIVVKAVAYSSTALTNIAYSSEITTNSLFADLEEVTEDGTTKSVAKIANFRHLENLDKVVSNLNASALSLNNAEQIENLSKPETGTSDLSWSGFVTAIKATKTAPAVFHVYKYDDTSAVATSDDYYRPVNPDYKLTYDGKSHSISGVDVNSRDTTTMTYTGATGLFGAPTQALTVKNLKLIDFNLKSDGNAGALAGTLPNGSSVENVLACNSATFDKDTSTELPKTTITASGSVGGLIGSITDGSVTKSAAALVVKSESGNAGGLIGTVSGSTAVAGCYSGGHTSDGKYSGTLTGAVSGYNVTATEGTAGGLIGVADAAIINNSYSTCSAAGTIAGGFVGTGGTPTNCYAAGLVRGTGTDSVTIDGVSKSISKDGAFAYSLGGTATNCKYFEIVNERAITVAGENNGFDYLSPVVATATNPKGEVAGITKLDDSAEIYNNFSMSTSASDALKGWQNATSYDTTLGTYYYATEDSKKIYKYNLETVAQLGQTGVVAIDSADSLADFVATHYGDWPAPEIFVMNQKTGS